jgi:hypothetical protein
MSTEWTARQLISFPITRLGAAAPARHGFNPRPPGVIRHGSTTDAVLSFLATHSDRRWRHWQIVVAVKRPHKTVSWALVYLGALGLIESTPDASHSRYKKYKAIDK